MNVAPIHSIVEKKRKDRIDLMLALLIYSDADVDLKRADGMTALHLAAKVGGLCEHYEWLVYFIPKSWNLDVRSISSHECNIQRNLS